MKLSDLHTDVVAHKPHCGIAPLALPLQCRATVGRAAAVRPDTDLQSSVRVNMYIIKQLSEENGELSVNR